MKILEGTDLSIKHECHFERNIKIEIYAIEIISVKLSDLQIFK